MGRSKRSQSKHDALVRRIAKRLEGKGFDVEADIRGYPQPKTVAGYRPDVVGKKGRARKIYEVETEDSVDSSRDQGQKKAFRQAADKSKHTSFRREVVD